MISVLITVTALIPIFGAFIGLIIGAFLILVANPVQALWFVVMFLIIQQVEGNLIYPRVVGSSVGLPVPVGTGGSNAGRQHLGRIGDADERAAMFGDLLPAAAVGKPPAQTEKRREYPGGGEGFPPRI